MRGLISGLFVMLLAACATSYQETSWANLGVSAASMGGDTYRVNARLNVFSNQNHVQDYLLLRAAETAQANGSVGFVILSERDTTESATVVTPGTSTTTASAYGAGNSAYGSVTTTYTPPIAQTFESAPGGMIMIRLVREPVPEGLVFINAAETIAAISPRVRRH